MNTLLAIYLLGVMMLPVIAAFIISATMDIHNNNDAERAISIAAIVIGLSIIWPLSICFLSLLGIYLLFLWLMIKLIRKISHVDPKRD